MFRVARGFIVIVPLAFLAALATYLWTHGRAVEAFTPYPFLVEALGPALVKRPMQRFAVIAAVAFLLPYLVTSLLLFLADAGTELAARLWGGKRGRPASPLALPPESVWTFVVAAVGSSVLAARSLDRVAHGGELPGGVNITPILVAAVPFAGAAVALVLAALASVPRSVASLWSAPPAPSRPERR
jgi:uncharacterized membrane protein (DUF485 family)